jgi:hypothetical protein
VGVLLVCVGRHRVWLGGIRLRRVGLGGVDRIGGVGHVRDDDARILNSDIAL